VTAALGEIFKRALRRAKCSPTALLLAMLFRFFRLVILNSARTRPKRRADSGI
jgi:hypothetical protein